MIPKFLRLTPAGRAEGLRCAAAFVLGALGVLALPPYYLTPVLWPALAGLAWLSLTASGWRRAALRGWCFGLGWFGFGLYWIGYAFLVDAELYGFLMPFAVGGMAAGMALFTALVAGAVHQATVRLAAGPVAAAVLFAGLWTVSEWLRSWFLTGFPWNPLSSVWGFSDEMMQSSAAFSALGLGFLTALIFAAPVSVARAAVGPERRRALAALFAVSLVLPLLWYGGTLRLRDAGTVTHEGVVLRLVQPDIAQADKWRSNMRQSHVIRQMAMSKRTPGPAGTPTHVIWAETNVPFLIEPDSLIPSSLAPAVPPGGSLIFGAPRRARDGAIYNSLFAIDDDGATLATFDKFHLVPFGEYVPLRWLLPINKLTAGRGDFAAGTGPTTIHMNGLPPFAPIICYEVIFAGAVVDATDRPEWILNITNDAWFGPSSGPRQHLVQARLRAIEEGLPVVRVANTGISAVIDAYGRVRNRLELGTQGVLDAPLPVAIAPPPAARLGPMIGLGMALLALLIAAAPGLKNRFIRRA